MALSDQDRRISGLIQGAQDYADPTDQIPKGPILPRPPSWGSADSTMPDDNILERSWPPEWFEPQTSEPDWDDDGVDQPTLTGDGDFSNSLPRGDSEVSAGGIEALAYYAPFHFYRRSWGIYIRDFGLAYIAAKFKGSPVLVAGDAWIVRAAYWFLWRHEYFHFLTEVASTRMEVLSGQPILYQASFSDPSASWLEEAMANAHAYMQLRTHVDDGLTQGQVDEFLRWAADWMKGQPQGYRDYDRWSPSVRAFNDGRRLLVGRMLEWADFLTTHHGSRGLALRSKLTEARHVRAFDDADYGHVPVVRVHDSAVPWIRYARYFPPRDGLRVEVHTREHAQPHIHVKFADKDEVRLAWSSLEPLDKERALSTGERSRVQDYVDGMFHKIDKKVRSVVWHGSGK